MGGLKKALEEKEKEDRQQKMLVGKLEKAVDEIKKKLNEKGEVIRKLEEKVGGESVALDGTNRRTVYARVGRYRQDETLSLFDFPSSSVTSEQRAVTNVPLQRLFFLNSGFILKQSAALAARVAAEASEEGRIVYAHRLLYQREPVEEELELGREFLRQGSWAAYAQVLLSANEFAFID